jgi:hypothetical protein
MLTVDQILHKYKVHTIKSLSQVIYQVGGMITDSRTPTKIANQMIKDFGGPHVRNQGEARVTAKVLFEQAHVNGQLLFNLDDALKNAKERIVKYRKEHPEWFIEVLDENGNPPVRKTRELDPEVVERQNKARKIYEEHKEKSATEIAKIMAEKLSLTQSNAYYYASKFKKADGDIVIKDKKERTVKKPKAKTTKIRK